MSKAQEVNDSNFEEEVIKNTSPVLVDFWAPWCGPCRMMAPIIEAVSAELAGKFKVVKLNVDENPSMSAKYAVMSIPTMIVFKNGQESEIMVGFIAQKNLAEKLRSHL